MARSLSKWTDPGLSRVAIPLRDSMSYHGCVSTQITIRLPDDVVAFIDGQVASKVAPSRAAVVAQAVERERRILAAERDAAIYAQAGDDADLAAFTRLAAAQPPGLD